MWKKISPKLMTLMVLAISSGFVTTLGSKSAW